VRVTRITTLVCTSVLLISTNSFASKARLAALQFAGFWKDTQTVFTYPQYAGDIGQYATLEFGATGKGTGIHAEGGFQRKLMDGNGGLYLGHYNSSVSSALSSYDLDNPFYLYFGNGNMGYGLNFNYSDVKSTANGGPGKTMNIGATFGMKVMDFNVGLVANIFAKSEVSGVSTKVLPEIELNANNSAGSLKYYFTGVLGRTDTAGTTNTGYSFKVGAQEHAFKLGTTGTFFYGAEIGYSKTPGASGDTKNLNLPLYAGIEADVVSWWVVRGAIAQTLVGYNDTGVKDINGNSTNVTFGSGLKLGSLDVDALLTVAGTGAVNTATFATNASATYHF
jgi:hypothetical protein